MKAITVPWSCIALTLFANSPMQIRALALEGGPPKYKTRMSRRGGVELLLVPAGFFRNGWPPNNYPQYFLDSFLIGRTPVTVGQFKAYCRDQHIDFSKIPPPSWGWVDNHPMVNVNWYQARAFCKWAGGDLPTGDQWVKAAIGVDGRRHPWGNEFDPEHPTNYIHVMPKTPNPVGFYPLEASPYGCLDMIGNVYQWCSDECTAVPYGEQDTNKQLRGGYQVQIEGAILAVLSTPMVSNGVNQTGHSSRFGFRMVANP